MPTAKIRDVPDMSDKIVLCHWNFSDDSVVVVHSISTVIMHCPYDFCNSLQ